MARTDVGELGSEFAAPEAAKGRPRPQIAQLKRTFHFLSKNTLAMVGLVVLLFFIVVAIYSFFYHAPGDHLAQYCSALYSPGAPPSNNSCICVYATDQYTSQPAPNCYPVYSLTPSLIGPTINLAHFQGGPLPFGSLVAAGQSSNYFFNTYDGLIKGAPWSLGISVAIVGSGALIGLLLGAVSGYKGGYTDETIMRATDIFLSIPNILLVLVALAVFGPSIPGFEGRIFVLIGAFVITWWPFYTRIVRGQVLVTREQKYVEASKASGAKTGRILRKHIIPNSIYPVFVQMSLDVGTIPLLLGAIVFLGFPIWPSPAFPEWGTIAAYSVQNQILETSITSCQVDPAHCVFPWWQVLFPGLTVFLFAISVNFLSDGLRDALDPRLRR